METQMEDKRWKKDFSDRFTEMDDYGNVVFKKKVTPFMVMQFILKMTADPDLILFYGD